MTATATTPAAATDAAPVVQAQGLRKSLDGRGVLRDIDLHISPGEIVALLGANGAGKSTLLRVLATLIRSDAGTLKLFGDAASEDLAALRARIGLIGHQSMLYGELSARENLE